MMLREPRMATYPFGKYWWVEVNPHEYQIRRADPAQTVIGRLVEVPPHGRDKGKWLLPDANQEYQTSESAVAGLEIWHKMDQETAPPTHNGHAPELPTPPPDTAGLLGVREAAPLYGVSRAKLQQMITEGKVPGVRKVPWGNRAGYRYLVPPPAPPVPLVEPVAAPVPEPPAPPKVKAPATPKLQDSSRERDLWAEISRLQDARREDALCIGRQQAEIAQLNATVNGLLGDLAKAQRGWLGGLLNGHTKQEAPR